MLGRSSKGYVSATAVCSVVAAGLFTLDYALRAHEPTESCRFFDAQNPVQGQPLADVFCPANFGFVNSEPTTTEPFNRNDEPMVLVKYFALPPRLPGALYTVVFSTKNGVPYAPLVVFSREKRRVFNANENGEAVCWEEPFGVIMPGAPLSSLQHCGEPLEEKLAPSTFVSQQRQLNSVRLLQS